MDHVEAEGIVWRSQVPDRDDPDRAIRCLGLNREHPVAEAALANGPFPKIQDSVAMRKSAPFRPIKVSGRPVSEQIIRDRDHDRF